MDEQLLREFLAEAEDSIEALFGDVRALRERASEGHSRRELVNQIFRHVHTIKGTALACGLEATGETAHELESLLDGVRMGRVAVRPEVLDAFEDAIHALEGQLVAASRRSTDAEAVPRQLFERMRLLASADVSSTPKTRARGEGASSALDSLPEEIAQSLSEYERHRLREAEDEGARLFLVSVDFDFDTFDEQFRALTADLARHGEVVSTLPGTHASTPERVHFRILHTAPPEHAQNLAAHLAPFGATLVELQTKGREAETHASDTDETLAPPHAHAPDSFVSVASLTNLVRVPLEELDNLISSTRELSKEADAALGLALANDATGDARAEIETRAARIRRGFNELEKRLIGLRTVRVRQVLERAARVGESVARSLGREIDFEISGGELCFDKTIADRLAEPLLHILRNAVAHGIEPCEERVRAGKSARGRVRLEALAEDGCIVLCVTDDGRGIDPEHVARVAAERGLIARDAKLNEEQILLLIFSPGFSTAGELSSAAGRGVGLDAVERAVAGFGGEVRVRSRTGEGTTFEIRLPKNEEETGRK